MMQITTLAPRRDIAPFPITIGSDGMVRGSFPAEAQAAMPVSVDVVHDLVRWATVPVLAAGLDGPEPSFTCRLPPVRTGTTAQVSVMDADRGTVLFEAERVDRGPIVNAHGLSAADVYATVKRPMFAAPWLSFDGARLTVSGAQLPPGGDPSALSVRMGPGVSYDFRYPMQGPEFGTHFWFWPNAHLSNFMLTIDLARSETGCDPFFFDFVYGNAPPALRQRVWLPTDLSSFVGHPHAASQISRTQGTLNQASVTLTGYTTFRALEAKLAEHGVREADAPAILDWGCGHGRVTRHFLKEWARADVFGADIDAENVAWCSANMAEGTFEHVPLMPPTTLPQGHFDAVIGISVMTHLSADTQQAWLAELARTLKPGGLALLTFGEASAAAWGSLWHQPAWWEGWIRSGFDDGIPDPALNGRIGSDSYYRHTVQSAEMTRKAWATVFDVVSIEPDLVGNQSLAVLRRR